MVYLNNVHMYKSGLYFKELGSFNNKESSILVHAKEAR